MKSTKYIVIYAAAVTIALVVLWNWNGGTKKERERLISNQNALLSDIETYKTAAGKNAAEVKILTLKANEFEYLLAQRAAEVKALKIKVKNLQSLSRHVIEKHVTFETFIRDTIVIEKEVPVKHQYFLYSDAWTYLRGEIRSGDVTCTLYNRDTLQQAVHRVPKRFLFIRYGTKELRQTIVSSNPHTTIIYSEHIQLTK